MAASLRSLGVTGRVLVGVSGGADSVALLCALVRITSAPAARQEPRPPIVAAHLDHQLRGDESTADAAFVRRLCASLNVPLVVESVDVRRIAAEQGMGMEEAARTVRYDFLSRTAFNDGYPWVLVAHTADDQVETVLHHILRGTGLNGLRGIPRTRPLAEGVLLARPLLDVYRVEIEAYLRAVGQDWRTDASNRDLGLTRNRIRHELLPDLRDRYNPQVDAALIQLARQAADVQAVIDEVADELLADCCLDAGDEAVRLDAAKLENLPVHLVREVLKRAWILQRWPLVGMGFDHWATLAKVACGLAAAVDFRGAIHAERRGTLLVLTRK